MSKEANGKRGRGRPPGTPKTGGRKVGVPNKLNPGTPAAIGISRLAAFAGEIMLPVDVNKLAPLQVMLGIMHARVERGDEAGALIAAIAAAPYVHPKLVATEVTVRDERSVRPVADILAEIKQLEQQLAHGTSGTIDGALVSD